MGGNIYFDLDKIYKIDSYFYLMKIHGKEFIVNLWAIFYC